MWQSFIASWIGRQVTDRLTSWQTTLIGASILAAVVFGKTMGWLDESISDTIILVAGMAGLIAKDGAKNPK